MRCWQVFAGYKSLRMTIVKRNKDTDSEGGGGRVLMVNFTLFEIWS